MSKAARYRPIRLGWSPRLASLAVPSWDVYLVLVILWTGGRRRVLSRAGESRWPGCRGVVSVAAPLRSPYTCAVGLSCRTKLRAKVTGSGGRAARDVHIVGC